MRRGEGERDMPAWDDESIGHYLWRLAQKQGRDVGAEPPVKAAERGRDFAPALAAREAGEEG